MRLIVSSKPVFLSALCVVWLDVCVNTLHNNCVWVCGHACECLSLLTCLCLCWLFCRRGRSGARTTMSCSWQTSMPTRGNSTRQLSFTNAPATNPEPWACTLTCACSSTPRWLGHWLTKAHIRMHSIPLYQYGQNDLGSAACCRGVEHMFFFIMCSYAKLGPRTVFKRPRFTVCLSSPRISLESPHISSDQYTHTHTPCFYTCRVTYTRSFSCNGAQMERNKANVCSYMNTLMRRSVGVETNSFFMFTCGGTLWSSALH